MESPAGPQAWRGTLARQRCRRLRAVYTIMRWFRRHKVRAHLAELQRRFQAARQPPLYGRDLIWPPPPAVLQPFQDTCQALFCRCRPQPLPLRFSPFDLLPACSHLHPTSPTHKQENRRQCLVTGSPHSTVRAEPCQLLAGGPQGRVAGWDQALGEQCV